MQLPRTNLRNGGVEAGDLEIGVGGGRAIPLHCNQPRRGNLMGVLQRKKEKHELLRQKNKSLEIKKCTEELKRVDTTGKDAILLFFSKPNNGTKPNLNVYLLANCKI